MKIKRTLEQSREYHRKWRSNPANKAKDAVYGMVHYYRNIEWRRLQERLREKRITLDQFHAKAEAQDFLCAICQTADVGRKNSSALLYIDHDHETGKMRGLLCHHCNDALGKFKDDVGLMLNAIVSLDKYAAMAPTNVI